MTDYLNLDLPTLMSSACEVRDAFWGTRVTYSRKVFIPLTNMCRDTCGYCTFVQHPDSPGAQLMTHDEVLRKVRAAETFLIPHVNAGTLDETEN